MWNYAAGSNNPNIRCLPTFSQAALLKRLNLEELVDCALDASVGLWVSWRQAKGDGEW